MTILKNLLIGSMSSLRIKIVLSLIGISIFSIALGGFSSRLVLSDRFHGVVTARSSVEFSRDVLGYYRQHGSSFEQAFKTEPWAEHQAVLNKTRQRSVTQETKNKAHFIATDLQGKVWIPNGSYAAGDVVPKTILEDAIPIIDTNIIGYVIVEGQLALSGAEAQYLRDLVNSLWLSFFIVGLIVVPTGIVLGKRLTGPINKLNSAITAMRPNTMSQSVPITSNDEIGMLSQSFNQMSEALADFVDVTEKQKQEIAKTEAVRRQGLASISHELRTPLYRLISQAYAMIDGIRPLDRSEMKKHANSLDHLSELVNDLHHLALSDVHAFKCDIEATDFAGIIRNAIYSRKEVFLNKELTMDVSLPKQLIVDADPTRLRQIIENLLSNCVRYTNPMGDVSISLTSSETFVVLIVSDNGPGVPSESIESLFDRFYRVESSRNRTTGGSGLGLSLVKTCAEMHGGNVKALPSKQGGLSIFVRLPLHSAHH